MLLSGGSSTRIEKGREPLLETVVEDKQEEGGIKRSEGGGSKLPLPPPPSPLILELKWIKN